MSIRCLLLSCAALALPAQSPLPSAPVSVDDAAMRLAQARREARALLDAEAVVIARVRGVEPTPGVWCGIAVTWQFVRYELIEKLRGPELPAELRVGHLLVAGSRWVAAAPYLRPESFQPGARLLLALHRGRTDWVVADEDHGARAIDPPAVPDPKLAAIVARLARDPAIRQAAGDTLRIRLDRTVPLPVPLAPADAAVEFLPPELLRDEPHLRIERIRPAGAAVEVDYAMLPSGPRGTLRVEAPAGR